MGREGASFASARSSAKPTAVGELLGGRLSRAPSAAVARAMVAFPLSLALCLPPAGYALARDDAEGLRALSVSSQESGIAPAGEVRSELYEEYLSVLFRAVNGLGEFAENYQASNPETWSPEYFLFDLGCDGVPELMVRANVHSEVGVVHVFTAKSGKATPIGSYWEWSGGSAGNARGNLYSAGWNKGNSYVNAVTFEGGKIVSRFLKSGKATAEEPTGEMRVVNSFLAQNDATWLDSSPATDYGLLEQQARYSLSKGVVSVASAGAYTGEAQTPRVTVKFGKQTLREGTDYTVSYSNNVNAGLAGVVVTGVGNYRDSLSTRFSIARADIAKAAVSLEKAGAYTGAAKTPAVSVRTTLGTLRAESDYSVSYKNNKNAGTATAVITGRGNYQGSKKVSFAIAKAKNPLKLTGVPKTLTAKSLAKKARTFTALRFQKRARGRLTFSNASSAAVQKAVSVDRASGYLTVKQGAKARSYAVKVRVSAAGDANHLPASKTIPVKVNVV